MTRRSLFIGVLFFLCLLGHGGAEEPGAPISFTIEPDRTTYATSDKVIMHLEVKNISEKPVEVVDFQQTQSLLLSAQVVSFYIEDKEGEVYLLQGPVTDYWPGDRLKSLSKGDTMETDLIINDHNGRNYYRMGRQSAYKIYATYAGLNSRPVISNEVVITLE